MKINLVNNGVFPITKDMDGNPLPGIPDTGYNVAGTLQGEGKLIGMPCLFIRTSGCNLRCAWVGSDGKGSPCDTPFSSHNPEKNKKEIEDIVKLIKANAGNVKHVVVSGGEPTLQTKALGELMVDLHIAGFHTTLETNATIFDETVGAYTNLMSMSPKLSSSTPWEANLKDTGIGYNEKWANKHEKNRINLEVIQTYIDGCLGSTLHDFQLKFVVSSIEDITEIENDFLKHLKGVKPEDVCLMPEGVTSEDLKEKTDWIVQEALVRGWRFTPRMHINLWGKARSV